jgi:hypothetical protein
MRFMCAKRDDLWQQYDAALAAYIAVVNRFVQLGRATAEITETRAKVEDSRAQVRQHCVEHGCDPEYPAEPHLATDARSTLDGEATAVRITRACAGTALTTPCGDSLAEFGQFGQAGVPESRAVSACGSRTR